jgi:hypothetical protein
MNDLREYVDEIIGTPYVWWRDGMTTLGNVAPFWASHGDVPSASEIVQNGCNCTGFINLLRRKRGMTLPGVVDGWFYGAGICAWTEALREVLMPFDADASYPEGTLLLRTYRDPEDQGHVAVLWSSGSVLAQKLAHSYIADGIAINKTVAWSHAWAEGGYYEYVCLPENWIVAGQ